MTRIGPDSRRNIDDLLDEIDALHSYPPVLQQILALTRDEDFDIRRVVDCVQHEPAIAASLLRFANSSHFGLINKVANVQHALVYLGRRTLRLAVLNFGLADRLMKSTPASLFEHYWRHALTMACAARRCVNEVNGDDDTAYSAGLFADLGVLVFAQVEPSAYPPIYLGCNHGIDLVDAERRTFGFDHTTVTARLLSRWNFPANVVEATANHESYSPDRNILDQAVHTASLLAEAFWNSGIRAPSSMEMHHLRRVLQDEFDIDVDGLISLAESCRTEFRECAELFRVRVAGDIDAAAICREARQLYRDTAMDAVIHLDAIEGVIEDN